MIMVKSMLSLIAFFLLINPIASASEYIVDAINPNSSDSNPGTLELPLKTIQMGVNKAESGDTVTIMAGNYSERVRTVRAGNINYPITLVAKTNVDVFGFTILHDYINIKGFNVYADLPISYDALIYIQAKYDRVSSCRLHDAAAYAVSFGTRS